MNSLILLLVVVILLVIIAGVLAKRGRTTEAPPYRLTKAFLSDAELSFFGVLRQSVGDHGLLFAKVRIADVLDIKRGLSPSRRQSAFNRIQAKHFDFLVCSPTDARPLVAIELDDKSHRRTERMKRDAFIDGAAEAAGLPLLRVPAKHGYSMIELRRALAPYLQPYLAEPTVELPTEPQERTAPTLDPSLSADRMAVPESAQSPACPKCGTRMVKRHGKTGALAGKTFWGCVAYPKCRGVIPVIS